MIKLDQYEKRLIRLCKGKHQYKKDGDVITLLKKYYKSNYALDPDQYYDEFTDTIFKKLFETYMKIRENKAYNSDLIDLFSLAFNKRFYIDNDVSIERVITGLYGQIQGVTVIENGEKRFELY